VLFIGLQNKAGIHPDKFSYLSSSISFLRDIQAQAGRQKPVMQKHQKRRKKKMGGKRINHTLQHGCRSAQ
jgi:hypothetical protein